MFWLLHDDTLQQLREAHKRVTISTEQQRAFVEREEREAADRGPRSLRVAGEVAEIRVEGLLTKRPDFLAWLFGMGNTAYTDLLEAIAVARSNADVKAVQLFVDSPGGDADGLFDVFAALEQLRAEKPIKVRAANAFSAAYGIAAVAGPIMATTGASMFGSVGVAVRYARWADVSVYDITNTESPDKRPDPATEAGQAVIRRELDAIFDLFADAIARGRETTKEDVIENFGRGASFVAGEAKRRGMIDTIPKQSAAKPALRVVSDEAAPAAGTEGSNAAAPSGRREKVMNLEQLRAQHPELYAEAVQVGATNERKRVNAHLKAAQSVGAMEIAMKAIASGVEFSDQEVQAEYFAARINQADRTARQEDDKRAGKALENVETGAGEGGEGLDLVDRAAAALDARRKAGMEASHG